MRDINSMVKGRLWVPVAGLTNDADEFPFYVDRSVLLARGVAQKDMDLLAEEYRRRWLTLPIISFGASPRSRRLWSYYARGFTGFAIGYRVSDIEERLKGNVGESHVEYISTKVPMTDDFLNSAKRSGMAEPVQLPGLFKKSRVWEGENEIRFLPGTDFLMDGRDGFFIKKLWPVSVYVGFRMKGEKKDKIKRFCQERGGIGLYVVSTDLYSREFRLKIEQFGF